MNHEEVELDDAWKAKFEEVYAQLGNYGERVLGTQIPKEFFIFILN